jgi:hypothetical protein
MLPLFIVKGKAVKKFSIQYSGLSGRIGTRITEQANAERSTVSTI